LIVAVSASFLLQMGALYFPPLTEVLKMTPLSLEQLGLAFIAAGSALLIVPKLFIKSPKKHDYTHTILYSHTAQ